jgi:hypothetical protein
VGGPQGKLILGTSGGSNSTRRNGAPSAASTMMGMGRGPKSYRRLVGFVRESGGAGADAGMYNSGMSGGRVARKDEENTFSE